jgi:hypothetical protein
MEIKRPALGHMHQFLQEREDWRKVLAMLRACQHSKVMGVPKALDSIIDLAAANASKQFPNYQMFQFPTSFQAVDNVIIWREAGKILLGRSRERNYGSFPVGLWTQKTLAWKKVVCGSARKNVLTLTLASALVPNTLEASE